MNYRHAFHAGNFADVFKHVLLSRMLVYLGQKPAAFRVIDTHAGIGRYDLAGPEASRTGEWRDGIGRLLGAALPSSEHDLLAPYLDAVGPIGADGRPDVYPGSPVLAQHLCRAQDRLLLSERHPEDVVTLRKALGRDSRVKVLGMDGYAALNAALPPPERRGLVLIDPPFEEPDEFGRLVDALGKALRKWATGTYAIWYPIKDDAAVAAFAKRIASMHLPDHLWLEMSRPATTDAPALRGCGMLVVNAPYVLADEARTLLPFLAQILTSVDKTPFHWTVQDGGRA